jgi:hypothetical protein
MLAFLKIFCDEVFVMNLPSNDQQKRPAQKSRVGRRCLNVERVSHARQADLQLGSLMAPRAIEPETEVCRVCPERLCRW